MKAITLTLNKEGSYDNRFSWRSKFEGIRCSIRNKLCDPIFIRNVGTCVGLLISILFWLMLFKYGVGTALVSLIVSYIVFFLAVLSLASFI